MMGTRSSFDGNRGEGLGLGLERLTDRVFYWPGGVNLGIILGDHEQAMMVDTGLDATNAKKAVKELESLGRRLTAVINTHSHADHCGGNAEIARRTGAGIYTTSVERAFVEHPFLEPWALYGSAYPPPTLQTRFLLAAPSGVTGLLRAGPLREQGLAGFPGVTVVDLPGHSPGQVGVSCDGVLFCGDAYFSGEVLAKHRIPFFPDIDRTVATWDSLEQRAETWFVPGHGTITGDIRGALAPGREHLETVAGLVFEVLAEPQSEEEVLWMVTRALGVEITNDPQYYLDRAAMGAYLSRLAHQGRVEVDFGKGRRLWRRIV